MADFDQIEIENGIEYLSAELSNIQSSLRRAKGVSTHRAMRIWYQQMGELQAAINRASRRYQLVRFGKVPGE